MKLTVIKKRYALSYLYLYIFSGAFFSFIIIWGIKTGKIEFGEFNLVEIMFIYIFPFIHIFAFIEFFWDLFFGKYSNTLEISKEGVRYKSRKQDYFLEWNSIDSIMVHPYNGYTYNKSIMIYFIRGSTYPLPYKGQKQFNENLLGIQFRKNVVDEIKIYWEKPIQGIHLIIDKDM